MLKKEPHTTAWYTSVQGNDVLKIYVHLYEYRLSNAKEHGLYKNISNCYFRTVAEQVGSEIRGLRSTTAW